MTVRMRNGRPHEEVCDECENTNGEHKPWCHRGKVARQEALSERARDMLKRERERRRR